MTIRPADPMPSGTLTTMTPDGPRPLATEDLFAGKRVALFGVPGAFTPTCSGAHLPGFLMRSDELAEAGVDTIACMAVNDVFVMDAWGREQGVGDRILMLADGNGDYARALGLELDGRGFGMGMRSKRFSALVEDGVVRSLHVEPAGGVTVSDVETMLGEL